MNYLLNIVLIVVIYDNFNLVKCDNRCPAGWDAYDNQLKCIKIIGDTLATYTDGQNICGQQAQGSSLWIVHTQAEQSYLTSYLFSQHRLVNSIWLGGQISQQQLQWSDSSQVTYTNWLDGRPEYSTQVQCLEMQSQESTQGKWLDTVCNKRNQVVCQLGQSQQPIDELRRLIQQTQQQVEQLQQHIQVLETNYNQLAENPVPVGFIYVQLGQQQRPQHLWPQSSIKWYDITQQYAGLFFRAEGPDSAKFGEIQPANWSRLSTIRTRSCYTPDHGSYCEEFTTELGDTGGWSPEFIRKDFSNDMYFYVTTGLDNRPRNQAIRIYKRIA